MVAICCEGPKCNDGFSAKDREQVFVREHPGEGAIMREEAHKASRSRVSHDLKVTPHARAGVGAGGTLLMACMACGHERVYGHALWQP